MNPVEIPVFATGTHTSEEGVTRTWTRADLLEKANEFNSRTKQRRAPITRGHPKKGDTSAPAYGWATAFKVEDTSEVDEDGNLVSLLTGTFQDFDPKFVNAVKAGHYRERSIGLRGGKIDHVAWLGASAPAVKGLPEFTFSFSDDDELEHWAEAAPTNPTGTTMTPEEIQAVSTGIGDALKPQFEAQTKAIADLTAAVTGGGAGAEDDTSASAGKESETVTQLRETIKQQGLQIQSIESQRQDDSFSAFLDVEMKGKISPAEKAQFREEMKILAGAEDYDFTADGKTSKRSRLDDYKDRLRRDRTKVNPLLEEFAQGGEPTTNMKELDERRKRQATAHKRKPATNGAA